MKDNLSDTLENIDVIRQGKISSWEFIVIYLIRFLIDSSLWSL